MTRATGREQRVISVFLLAVLLAGCLALFIGVPLGVLWGLAKLTDSFVTHFVLGLIGIPLAIVLLSPALFWVNALYLRVNAPREEEWDEGDEEAWLTPRGPLEPILVVAFVVALISLCVWFFFFAENPVLTA